MWAGLMMIATLLARSAEAETIVEKQAAIERDYAERLEALARWCEEKTLPDQAAATRAWIVPRAPLTLVVPLADDRSVQVPDESDPNTNMWLTRFRDLRRAQGQRWFALAEQAVAERAFALAFSLVHATLREDLDHATARRLLGYKQADGKWLTQYQWNKAQAHQIWHPRFGWLPQKHISRYESGERFVKGRWISAEDDARLHGDIEHGWDIFTEHYQVHTNHSLQAAARLATRLEEFYGVWRQIFVRYYATEEQLARLFREGAPPNRTPRHHKIVYFRDREEYNQSLVKEQPNIDITSGFYLGSARTAYFFAGEDADDGTIYHEATHQLFSERRPVSEIDQNANFWVVEGIACFMESYQPGNSLVVLGGADATRLLNARTRLLRDEFYLPLAELCELSMNDLQRHEDIRMLYGEASGMTYFLMLGQAGRYRQSLVDYLAAVYANRDRGETLAELTGTTYSKLDEQYRHFIQHLP
jgi:hypothetical protein